MTSSPIARFYDDFAAGYHLLYADWEASVARQGAALDALIRDRLGDRLVGRLGDRPGDGAAEVLDCACGIGTQAIGLAGLGHRVTGTDLSPVAAGRAAVEAAQRGLDLATAAADMRQLPFPDGRFDVVVCADNAVPHLLTPEDVLAALGEMRRVLRPGGMLLHRVPTHRTTPLPPRFRGGPARLQLSLIRSGAVPSRLLAAEDPPEQLRLGQVEQRIINAGHLPPDLPHEQQPLLLGESRLGVPRHRVTVRGPSARRDNPYRPGELAVQQPPGRDPVPPGPQVPDQRGAPGPAGYRRTTVGVRSRKAKARTSPCVASLCPIDCTSDGPNTSAK
ncbi:class I SAM-dependent methyltransferase [Kitasatospora xanthocidica]|uniref:class I SAM-dependent methyltransferase n=1 Tax=Kitasatospora xanthocidica TaxID=83382 RepID=UPI0036EC1DFC